MANRRDTESEHEEELSQAKKNTESNGFGNGPVLDQLGSFLKANWKPLLKELAIAGVTTYVSYRAKFLWRKKR